MCPVVIDAVDSHIDLSRSTDCSLNHPRISRSSNASGGAMSSQVAALLTEQLDALTNYVALKSQLMKDFGHLLQKI